jgi:hypothetical protein
LGKTGPLTDQEFVELRKKSSSARKADRDTNGTGS